MKRFRWTIQAVGAVIVLLLAPSLLLKIFGLEIPKPFRELAALAILIIPLECGLFLVYFNTAALMTLWKSTQSRTRSGIIQALLILSAGNLILGYAFVTAVKGMWLR